MTGTMAHIGITEYMKMKRETTREEESLYLNHAKLRMTNSGRFWGHLQTSMSTISNEMLYSFNFSTSR